MTFRILIYMHAIQISMYHSFCVVTFHLKFSSFISYNRQSSMSKSEKNITTRYTFYYWLKEIIITLTENCSKIILIILGIHLEGQPWTEHCQLTMKSKSNLIIIGHTYPNRCLSVVPKVCKHSFSSWRQYKKNGFGNNKA